MFYVPGWKIKINTDMKIFKTKCKFVGEDYGESYYRTALRNGDFLYSQGFGLIIKNADYYIVTFQIPKGIVKIEKSYLKPVESSSKKVSIEFIRENYPEILSEIIYSEIIDLLIEEGYSSPIKTRGFFGRKSKGILSNRGTNIAVMKNFENSNRNFKICEAETFRVSYEKNRKEYNVVYNPKHEIYEEDILLSQLNLKKSLLEKRKDIFLMNSEKILERFSKIDLFIQKLEEKSSLIKKINKISLNNFESKVIEIPKLISKSGKKIEFETYEEFTKKITQSFDVELQSINKLEIGILVDNRNEIPKILNETLKDLGFKIKIFHYDLQDEFSESLNKIDTELLFYIISDNLPNSNSKYHYFKEKMYDLNITSKVIRFSTLNNEKEMENRNAVKLSLLGLLYRYMNEPFWKLINDPFDLTVAITNTIRWKGYVNILSLAMDYSHNRFNTGDIKLRNNFDYKEIYNILENIVSNKLNEKRVIIISKYNTKNNHIERIRNWFREKGAVVTYSEISEKDEGRIFIHNEKNYLNPQPGSYLKIGENNSFTEFLMITSEINFTDKFEFKDNSYQKGLPQPLRIRIESKNEDEQLNVLKSIFWRTFIHPTSFVRPRVPIDLMFSEKNQSNIFKSKLLEEEFKGSVL